MVLSLCCCSLAVWTNSTPSSTMTTTLTSTWWRIWAAWTGWARVSWIPASVHSVKGASLCAPNKSQSTKSPSLCAGKGTTSSNIVIRKLETVDPFFFFFTPQFLADFALPPLLCYHFALAFSHCLAARENQSLFPSRFLGGVTAVRLIRAEQLSWNPVRLFCSPFSDYLHYSEIIKNG